MDETIIIDDFAYVWGQLYKTEHAVNTYCVWSAKAGHNYFSLLSSFWRRGNDSTFSLWL
jgi:hypothetical protein